MRFLWLLKVGAEFEPPRTHDTTHSGCPQSVSKLDTSKETHYNQHWRWLQSLFINGSEGPSCILTKKSCSVLNFMFSDQEARVVAIPSVCRPHDTLLLGRNKKGWS